LYLIVLLLIVGFELTGVLYFNFGRIDKERITARLKRGTLTLIQAISLPGMENNPMLDAIFGTMGKVRSDLPPGREIDKVYLNGFLWTKPPPGLETATLEYLPRVTINERRELESRFGGQLPGGFSINEAHDQEIIPAERREDYFPVLYEASRDKPVAPIGIDRGADPVVRLAIEQARDSGEFTTYSYFPLVGAGDQTMVSRYFLAIYKTGSIPKSIPERRAQLQGFITVATYYPMANLAAFMPESYQGMDGAFFPRENFQYDLDDPELSAGIEKGIVLQTPYLLPALNNAPWMGITRAKPEMIATMQSSMRWWVLGIGTLLTLWISGILLWTRSKSAKLIHLVVERTKDLTDQSEKFHKLNSELLESEARYRILADHASDIIYTLDLEGVCNYISPSITRQTGYETEEFIGYPITRYLSEDSADRVHASLEKVRTKLWKNPNSLQERYINEYELKCRDGLVLAIENTVTFTRDKFGTRIGILGVGRYVTEQKKNEIDE